MTLAVILYRFALNYMVFEASYVKFTEAGYDQVYQNQRLLGLTETQHRMSKCCDRRNSDRQKMIIGIALNNYSSASKITTLQMIYYAVSLSLCVCVC